MVHNKDEEVIVLNQKERKSRSPKGSKKINSGTRLSTSNNIGMITGAVVVGTMLLCIFCCFFWFLF